jgi:arsenate reductase (glutaredoxin)
MMKKKQKATIYYNPRCSKCREAMCSLEDNNIELEVVEYLKDVPTQKELKELIKKLGIKARELVRDTEPVFKEKYEGKKLTEAGWIKAMVTDPILIQRPIIIQGDKAIIGRPVERVLELFKK